MQWHENLVILTFLRENAGVEVRRFFAETKIMKNLEKTKEQDFGYSNGNTVRDITVHKRS